MCYKGPEGFISHKSRSSRCLSNLFRVTSGFLQEYINFKDFEGPFLEIFAQAVSNYLFMVFIRVKYLGTRKKTD